MNTTKPSVAVVVCTRDRPEDLARCLDRIKGQSHRPDQVIVVAGSDDSCPAGLGDVEVVSCAEHNISKSRNAGLRAAHTDIVLFIDDDALARAGWVGAIVEVFAREADCWAAGGDVYDSRTSPMELEFSHGLVSATGKQKPIARGAGTTTRRGFVPTVKGCNFGVRRKQIMDLGGFDPFFAFAFDESDLMMTIQTHGGLVLHAPEAMVDHAHTPGHYRGVGAFERDWRVEYASHTRFMRKHSTSGAQRLLGWCVIWRRLAKLAVVTGVGVVRGSVGFSRWIGILREASRGIGDGRL